MDALRASSGRLRAHSMAGAAPPGASDHPASHGAGLRAGRRAAAGGRVDRKTRLRGMCVQLAASRYCALAATSETPWALLNALLPVANAAHAALLQNATAALPKDGIAENCKAAHAAFAQRLQQHLASLG